MTDYDPETAHTSILNAGSITNKEERRLIVATQTALALVDIAESLRVLADAERFAMEPARIVLGDDVFDDDVETVEPEPVDLTDADAGTRVRLVADPGKLGELSGTGGVDQGIPWVGVLWDLEPGMPANEEARVFVPHLEAVHAPTVYLDAPANPFADADLDDDRPYPAAAPTDGLDALKTAKAKSKGKGKR